MKPQTENEIKTDCAHANVRKGQADYNDGGEMTHHLGNDESENKKVREETENSDGKVALGNQE